MLGRKDSKQQKPRRMSKILTEALVSGDEWLETVQIIQALQPVKDTVHNQIDGFNAIIEEFDEAGGTIEQIDVEGGYQIRFSLRSSVWIKVYDPNGIEVRDVKDDCSGSTDPDAMIEIAKAIRAAMEIPRREYVLEEIDRLVKYLESDNALAGLEKMKKIFEQDPTTLFEAASAVVPESMETDSVDMSSLVEVRGRT